MKIRHIQVIGDIAKPLPDRLAEKATHQLNLTNEKYDTYVNPTYFKVIDGEPVAKTQEELDAQEAENAKNNARNQAEALYKELKAIRVINGFDLSDTFEFDYQRKKGGEIRLKLKDGKTIIKTKQETEDSETALFSYLNSVADALDNDLDAIEAGDYSLTNLKHLVL